MTNPFENTKEPRFTGAFIFDTAQNMFTRNADVHTYGKYVYNASVLLPVISYVPSTVTFTENVAITPITPVNTGGAVDSWSISTPLPAGLVFNTTTGGISGTPVVTSLATTYTIVATNEAGSALASLTVSVGAVLPALPEISYSPSTISATKDVAISPLLPTNTGGAATSWLISPALPSGLSINVATGSITGTPTVVSSSTVYTVTAYNAAGSDTTTVTIAVAAAAGFGSLVDAGATIPRVNGVYSSNIGTITALSNKRCLAIAWRDFAATRVLVHDVATGAVAFQISAPATDDTSDLRGYQCVFIMGGKLYFVSRNATTTTVLSDLYVLGDDLLWDLVTTNIIWPGDDVYGYPTTDTQYINFNGVASNGWWGIKTDGYTYSSGGYRDRWSNPRLVKVDTSGVVTEYPATTATLPQTYDTSAFVVSGSRITIEYNDATNRRLCTYDISSGSPVLLEDESQGTKYTQTKHPITAINNGYTYVASANYNSTTGLYDNVMARMSYSGGTHQSVLFNSFSAAYIGAAAPGYTLRNVTGWSLDSTKNSSALGISLNGNQSVVYRFMPDLTVSQFALPTNINSHASSYDPVTGRIWMITADQAGATRLQYLPVS